MPSFWLQNILYIVWGIITIVGVNVCVAFVLIRLNHVNIQLVEYGPQFFGEELYRMARNDILWV